MGAAFVPVGYRGAVSRRGTWLGLLTGDLKGKADWKPAHGRRVPAPGWEPGSRPGLAGAAPPGPAPAPRRRGGSRSRQQETRLAPVLPRHALRRGGGCLPALAGHGRCALSHVPVQAASTIANSGWVPFFASVATVLEGFAMKGTRLSLAHEILRRTRSSVWFVADTNGAVGHANRVLRGRCLTCLRRRLPIPARSHRVAALRSLDAPRVWLQGVPAGALD